MFLRKATFILLVTFLGTSYARSYERGTPPDHERNDTATAETETEKDGPEMSPDTSTEVTDTTNDEISRNGLVPTQRMPPIQPSPGPVNDNSHGSGYRNYQPQPNYPGPLNPQPNYAGTYNPPTNYPGPTNPGTYNSEISRNGLVPTQRMPPNQPSPGPVNDNSHGSGYPNYQPQPNYPGPLNPQPNYAGTYNPPTNYPGPTNPGTYNSGTLGFQPMGSSTSKPPPGPGYIFDMPYPGPVYPNYQLQPYQRSSYPPPPAPSGDQNYKGPLLGSWDHAHDWAQNAWVAILGQRPLSPSQRTHY